LLPVHPLGEQLAIDPTAAPGPATLDTFAGPVRVEWDRTSSLTALGQMPFFIEFLKVSGLFEAWVGDCPLSYKSPNASQVRDVLGTAMLSILSGHKRYAHITALRSDGVLPELLGMDKIVSEDAVRRAFKAIDERQGLAWLERHMDRCTSPLLGEPYIIDIDTTVKSLFGHQEGAVVSYNPHKRGRPSHVHHTYMLAGLRLVMGVETARGNEHRGRHSAPGLWALLDRLGRELWPKLLRGDCGIGSQSVMQEAEQRGIDHLFKLRLTKNVKSLIERTFAKSGWHDAGQGWQGKEDELRLVGWSRQRRVVVLRRALKEGVVASVRDSPDQLRLGFAEIGADRQMYEYAVLVTSLDAEVLTIAQLYRDRADCENVFDELKNQWGWGGYTTQDLARCRLAARMVALVYNWWNLFVRLAEPDKHLEAITSRPLLLSGIAERVRHARQMTLRVTSTHGRAGWAQSVLNGVARFLRELIETAEQLTAEQRWYRILSHALRSWLKGRQLRAPPRLMAPA
ncbi:MAG: transposase, partial [Burkholderiales bacterium]